MAKLLTSILASFFLISVQSAVLVFYKNSHDTNICNSTDEINIDSCDIHCLLETLNETFSIYISGNLRAEFDDSIFKFVKTQYFKNFIELRSQSPPKKKFRFI
tara:strand:- start:3396 stop:3704 length:309 start_codon:yes stop_codon:yes gene_type:complete